MHSRAGGARRRVVNYFVQASGGLCPGTRLGSRPCRRPSGKRRRSVDVAGHRRGAALVVVVIVWWRRSVLHLPPAPPACRGATGDGDSCQRRSVTSSARRASPSPHLRGGRA
ncbi:MAG: hypothetical protein ACLU38_14920 [Dysosmobacter sp.]